MVISREPKTELLKLRAKTSIIPRAVFSTGEGQETGVPVVDAALFGAALPAGVAVLLSGEPGTGKTLLCHNLLGEALTRGLTGLYVALDDFPDNIRASLSAMGYDVKGFEADSRLLFIDAYSCEIGLDSRERYSCDRKDLSLLSIAITTALTEHGCEGATSIILDSLTTLLHRYGVKTSLEFLRMLIAKTRKARANLWIKLNCTAFEPSVVSLAHEMVDGVINLRITETEDGFSRLLSVMKMKGVLCPARWLPYELHPRKGLVPVKPTYRNPYVRKESTLSRSSRCDGLPVPEGYR
ncbi:MAG: RAD55 family ATPase [Candidatus Bathyarchaeia archaeon]